MHRLTMVGLEVDGVQLLHPHLRDVVVARLEELYPHPNADRLHLCRVSDGVRTYRIVCGAPNVRVGAIVPLARAGAKLPGGEILTETSIRGEISQGMLCSQKELGLGEDASGIWLLPPDIPIGVSLDQALGIEDTILDIGITPNRGDCLSIIGVAREVAAICGTALRYPDISFEESGAPIESMTSVTIESPVECPRYAARILEGVKIGPSPDWLRKRLEAVGMRSINNIVDVTNFIMMEFGQPLHAFDFDQLREHRIVVRLAREGERFTTLDGVERKLFADTLMICDGVGPVAVAGIMGGLDSEITQQSTRVLIESAYFQPRSIRRSSKNLGLRSESSYRFERGVDPEGVLRAVDRAAQLMQQVGGGRIARGRIDAYPNPVRIPELKLRVERTNRFLGTQLKASQMADALRSIEMTVEETDGGVLRVVPPSFRSDITREVDLTEEVVRLVGYDDVPVTSPRAEVSSEPLDPHQRSRGEVKAILQGCGFFEILTYSFVSPDAIRALGFSQDDERLQFVSIMNPLSEDQSVMRTTLVPGLLQTARHNFGHKNEDLRIFELSKVFLPGAGEPLPREPHHIALLMAGRRMPSALYGNEEEVDFTDIKGAVEAVLEPFYLQDISFRAEELPSYMDGQQAASVYVSGSRIGALGRLDPQVAERFDLKRTIYLFEGDFDKIFTLRQPHPLFRSLPKFPAVARDMAIVLDEGIAAQEAMDIIRKQQEPLLEHVEVFDIYRNPQLGSGKKSIGYRLVYRAPDRSLTDEEVNEVHGRLTGEVLRSLNAVLR